MDEGTLIFSLSRKELEEKLKSLGPDILTAGFTEDTFIDIMKRRTQQQVNICKFLMNQSVSISMGITVPFPL